MIVVVWGVSKDQFGMAFVGELTGDFDEVLVLEIKKTTCNFLK